MIDWWFCWFFQDWAFQHAFIWPCKFANVCRHYWWKEIAHSCFWFSSFWISQISFDGRSGTQPPLVSAWSWYLVFKWWANAKRPLGFGVALLVLLLYFWRESKGFRCSCRPVGSCMLMAWLVCDFEIKASLILVRAGLKAVSSVVEGRQQKERRKKKHLLVANKGENKWSGSSREA